MISHKKLVAKSEFKQKKSDADIGEKGIYLSDIKGTFEKSELRWFPQNRMNSKAQY